MITLKIHQGMIMSKIVRTGYTPTKAMDMKMTVSKNCDQTFDRFERNQKYLDPKADLFLKKKKAMTS